MWLWIDTGFQCLSEAVSVLGTQLLEEVTT